MPFKRYCGTRIWTGVEWAGISDMCDGSAIVPSTLTMNQTYNVCAKVYVVRTYGYHVCVRARHEPDLQCVCKVLCCSYLWVIMYVYQCVWFDVCMCIDL